LWLRTKTRSSPVSIRRPRQALGTSRRPCRLVTAPEQPCTRIEDRGWPGPVKVMALTPALSKSAGPSNTILGILCKF
jgi:hypothetical protein